MYSEPRLILACSLRYPSQIRHSACKTYRYILQVHILQCVRAVLDDAPSSAQAPPRRRAAAEPGRKNTLAYASGNIVIAVRNTYLYYYMSIIDMYYDVEIDGEVDGHSTGVDSAASSTAQNSNCEKYSRLRIDG